MLRIPPRHALTFFVAAFLLALAGVGIATAQQQPKQTTLAAVRDAASGLPTGHRS
jgi:ABC-type transporter Mla subunit MlaD